MLLKIGIIALVLFLLPFGIGLLLRLFECLQNKAAAGRIKAKWGLVFLIMAGLVPAFILLFPFYRWLPMRISFTVRLIIAVVILFIFFVSALLVLIESLKRRIWHNRIYKNLDGELGNKLKSILPRNAMYYKVARDGIKYLSYNTTKILVFRDFGYGDIPTEYANIVCIWIRDNLTYNKTYRISEIYKTTKEYVPGSPDTYKIEKKYGEYEVTKKAGSPSSYNYKETLIGYAMEAQEIVDARKEPKLRKW